MLDQNLRNHALQQQALAHHYHGICTEYFANLKQQDAAFERIDQTPLLRAMTSTQAQQEQCAARLEKTALIFSQKLSVARQECRDKNLSISVAREKIENTQQKIALMRQKRSGAALFIEQYGPNLGREIGEKICPVE
ncbi:MAG: hypothetical protein WCF65_07550 [Parachlamydiaceae bacterium]